MTEELTKKDDMGEMPQYPMFGVTSFAELDQLQGVYDATEAIDELCDQFCMLAGNIALDDTITDKTSAVRALAKEFASRINATVKATKEQRGGLLAGLRNMLKRPSQQAADAATSLGMVPPEENTADNPPIDTSKSFTLWKTKEGQYRWMAVYSNQFRDSDNPPEILSEKAHKTFVAMADAGLVDYPELWHWHLPGTAWGKADWLAYDNGFALASGYVYPGHEKEAELVSQMGDIRVSHGMPSQQIMRNPDDPSIIDMYVSVEISDLPGFAAANKLTDFVVLNKGVTEMLSPEKRDYLAKAGLDDATIAAVEANLATQAKAAKDAGIESKDTSTSSVSTEQSTEQPAYVTANEVAEVLASMLKPLTDAVNGIQASLGAVQAEVKALKESDESKVTAKAAGTPRASLAELIAMNIVGTKETQLDGRTALAKAGPRNAAEPEITGVPLIDGLIRRSQGVAQ